MVLAEVPFDLAEVKLAAPFTRPSAVAKADVVARLSRSPAPFVSVVAPAGYGKTTLLAQWDDADARPFAWVALDERDDDVTVFLRYLAAAIHRVYPMPAEALAALSGRVRGSGWAQSIHYVGGALARPDQPLVLALDDLHHVSNPSCTDVLAALVDYVPSDSRIVVTSREEPALPLARWRSQGRLLEFGVPDLRMDEHESGQLLAAAGVELEPSEVSDLNTRTEGWAAGLYLAALSIAAGAKGNVQAVGFVADDRFVSEYLHLELLSRLPPAEAEFLKQTSVLDRMNGELCDAVLETTGSAQVLDALARTNGFVVPLDRSGEWYRYHHLFGQLLRDELTRSEPGLAATLNRRAMTWCLDKGLAEAAMVHAHAAGETDSVAALLDSVALPLYYDGRIESLEEYVGWFSDQELARYPAIAVYGAWVRLLTGRPDDAERMLAIADGAASAIPLSDGSSSVDPWVANLRAHMMRNGVEQGLADANLALEELPPDSGWIPDVLMVRGIAHALLGVTDRATDDLSEAVRRGLEIGAVDDVFASHAQLALLAARQGAWSDAATHARAAQEIIEEGHLEDYSGSAIAFVATARVALHEGRHDDARTALTRAHRLRPLLDHGIPWLTLGVGIELTRAHLALGEASAARTVLSETERVLERRPSMGSLADDARLLHTQVAATEGSAGAWAMSLTGAELRLLPYLATHLTFPEIASRLFLSRNTVKTEAVSIYRKLGASSRSQTIERAIEVGLLDSSIYPQRLNLTQEG